MWIVTTPRGRRKLVFTDEEKRRRRDAIDKLAAQVTASLSEFHNSDYLQALAPEIRRETARKYDAKLLEVAER